MKPAATGERDEEVTDPPARRELFRAAAGIAGAALLSACSKPSAQATQGDVKRAAPMKWRAQAHVTGGTISYEMFVKFCSNVAELSDGQIEIEPHPAGEIVPTLKIFDALQNGKLDLACTSPTYPAETYPGMAFLASYPLGLDRPDQWETWYFELGGLDLARRMYEPHGVFFLAPLQHDLNIIHSRVPLRSFEDFRGKKIRMPGGLIADVFVAAGAKTVFVAGDQIYPGLQSGALDAADNLGPASNFNLGFANVAKYIIRGPRGTRTIHQPVDLHSVQIHLPRWRALPKHLQDVLEYASRRYSWDHFAHVQKENILAWRKFEEKGVEIIELTDADVEKFRKVAIPLWFKWAKMDPLGREAFASQLEYMKNPSVAYLTDDMLVDASGQKLTL
jgi:TRAP-type mannitol/chloroaromatic compound transport system substrate-binding protein